MWQTFYIFPLRMPVWIIAWVVWRGGNRCDCFLFWKPTPVWLGDWARLRWRAHTAAHTFTSIVKSLKSWESLRRGRRRDLRQALRFQPGWRRRGCVALGCAWLGLCRRSEAPGPQTCANLHCLSTTTEGVTVCFQNRSMKVEVFMM